MDNSNITKEKVIYRLEENGLAYREFELENGFSIIISAYSGRILGPFDEESHRPLFWLNKAFEDRDAFKDLIIAGLPMGGERLWISPEIQYGVKDRRDFWGTIFVPSDVDPGNYTLVRTENGHIKLEQEMELEAFNLASGKKELNLSRLITQTQDPLRHLVNYEEVSKGLTFTGYRHIISLKESQHDDVKSESWSLIQLNPGGRIFVPSFSTPQYTDYYEPLPLELREITDNYITARITGSDRYKIGIKATNLTGRVGYLNKFSENTHYLLVRNFYNNPALPYAEEPPASPGSAGHSVHIYNDDGGLGGFGELEATGQTIGGETGLFEAVDSMDLWIYLGSLSKLRSVAEYLLGIQASV